MKLLILTITVLCLQASSAGYSQAITLSLDHAPLQKVFKLIRKQSPYRFIYSREVIESARPVSLKVSDARIDEVLKICFEGQPLSYQLEGRQVIVKPAPAGSPNRIPISSPVPEPVDVRGRAVNENGEPVEGVSVKVKGSGRGTSTNEHGDFELPQVEENAVLVFSGTNVETYELRLRGRALLGNVVLKTRVSKLDELQIIGYGTNTQRYNVGSVTRITAEEIEKQPVSNPLAALQGRVPGLVVTATSGLPGASFNIQVRGQNTLNPDPTKNLINPMDNPLFIIDGVPFAPQNTNVNQFTSILAPPSSLLLNNRYGGVSPFSAINPQDIESIEVLRDADATAIYGSRGANGVILISTKSALNEKSRLNIAANTGLSFIPETMPMMSTREYLEMRREAFFNDGIMPGSAAGTPGYAPDLLSFDSTKYTDWKSYFLGNVPINININGSLSGGNVNTKFVIGGGIRKESSIFQEDFGYSRGSFNVSLYHESPNKKLSLHFSSMFSCDQNCLSNAPNLLSVYQLEPNFPELVDEDGNLVWSQNGVDFGDGSVSVNPLSYIKKKYRIQNNNLNSSLNVGYSVFKNLKFQISLGYNAFENNEYSASPLTSLVPDRNAEASALFGESKLRTWIAEPQLSYNAQFGSGRLTVLVGTSFQDDLNSSLSISASGYQNDALLESISAAPNRFVSDGHSEYRYNAVFGRANYILNNKYIINLSGRRDGSSRFGPNKQFGNFGAVGMGWIFSEEQNFKQLFPVLSFGKLRASYGSTGSDAIGNYQYVTRWSPTNYSFLGTVGYLPQNLFNSDFSWAVTKKFEVGLELGVLENQLLFTSSWYHHQSGNQLVSYPLPSQTGFPSVVENWVASVENRGWEFQIISEIIKSTTLSWRSTINLCIPKNRLSNFPGIETSPYNNRYVVGQPLNVLNKFKYTGVNDSTGIFQFETAAKELTYSPIINKDFQIIGNLDPKFYGGIGNRLRYHGIELDFFLEFRNQMGPNYLQQVYGGLVPGMQANQPSSLLDRWQQPGDDSKIQRFTVKTNSPAALAARSFTSSSGVYSDASFIKMRNISISYSLPSDAVKKMKLREFRCTIQVQNLFTISHYKGNDPEIQTIYGLPPFKQFTVGIQLLL